MNFVRRDILPVGQGAFYLETLYFNGETYKIIYDCGSSTNVNNVNDQISYNFEKGETIHAVFISHLDDDHVNGLEFLLKYCQVKHLFFPLITNETKKLYEFRNLINPQTKFLSQFININTNNNNNKFYEAELHPISEEDNSEQLIEETSGAIFGHNKIEWIYLPHNFYEDKRREKIYDELKKLKLSMSILNSSKEVDLSKLKSLWKNGTDNDRRLIKRAYYKVPGGLNINSMTLYSGSKSSSVRYFCKCCCNYFCSSQYSINYLWSNGCLYTGDYQAGRYDKKNKKWISCKQKWQSLESVYFKYFDNIGLIQIPHHGSKYNYNKGFRDSFPFAKYFASAGKNNRYRHPHKEVVLDLISNQKYFNVVTEEKNSKKTYCCHWW